MLELDSSARSLRVLLRTSTSADNGSAKPTESEKKNSQFRARRCNCVRIATIMTGYAIIQFTEWGDGNSVETVPAFWLVSIGSRQMCYYPKTGIKAIKEYLRCLLMQKWQITALGGSLEGQPMY